MTLKFSVFLLFIFYVSACRTETIAPVNQNIVNQSVVVSSDFSNAGKTTVENPSTKSVSSGEITNCAPEKFARGAKLVVNLKTPNGGYLAIERMGKKPDYFLLSDEENSEGQEFAATANAKPFWTTATLKTLKRIELDSTEARAVNLSKLDKQGKGKAELIFSQTGWYKIMLSNENFEQDEPAITGQCRVFYKGGDSRKQARANGELIEWNFSEKNLSFNTVLQVKDNLPVGFSIDGWRIITRSGFESPHDCGFAVEKGKDKSLWRTIGNKTFISGIDDLGNDFKMVIEKTGAGFLIDTSAAAESCFNVGMPGNILLFKVGNKYDGKFIADAAK